MVRRFKTAARKIHVEPRRNGDTLAQSVSAPSRIAAMKFPETAHAECTRPSLRCIPAGRGSSVPPGLGYIHRPRPTADAVGYFLVAPPGLATLSTRGDSSIGAGAKGRKFLTSSRPIRDVSPEGTLDNRAVRERGKGQLPRRVPEGR